MTVPNTTEGLATPEELVRLFIDEATRELTSLPVKPSLRCTTRVRHFGDDGWVDSSAAEITSWFEVTVAFTSEAIDGAFRFGERENAIWAEARPLQGEHAFALWEWSAVLGRVPGPWEGGEWVYEPERLRTIVSAFAEALREMHDSIAGASAATRVSLATAREARAGEDAERAREREQERDELQAAAAFRNGDYATAAKLLRKHVSQLSPAQQKKLAFAQTKVP